MPSDDCISKIPTPHEVAVFPSKCPGNWLNGNHTEHNTANSVDDRHWQIQLLGDITRQGNFIADWHSNCEMGLPVPSMHGVNRYGNLKGEE